MEKKKNQELSFKKKEREAEEEEEEKSVTVVTEETNGNWGNQMMLGPCHLATSEPMKSLTVEGVWLMLKNSYKMTTCLQSYRKYNNTL